MTILNGVPVEPEEPGRSRDPEGTASPESQTVGRVAGFIALVASVVFPPIGIVIAAIALQQARLGGYRNGFAKAALAIGIILTVLGVLAIVVLGIFVPQWVDTVRQFCDEHGVVVESPGSYECTIG